MSQAIVLVEQRQSRKIFKVKAVLSLPTLAPVLVRTVDIGATGMSVSVSDPLPMGLMGRISFDLLVDGKSTPIATAIKVNSCIFRGGDFKIALQFTGLDPASSSALTKFLR
jgi:hypothetical protein